MNKKLLETTLRSIENYNGQIKDLNESLNVVTSVRNDLIVSIKEFFPFYNEDIIMRNDRIYKFQMLNSVNGTSPNTLYFSCDVLCPDGSGGWNQREKTISIDLKQVEEWKKIN